MKSHYMNRTDIELWSGMYSRLIGPNMRDMLDYELIHREVNRVGREIKCDKLLGNWLGEG